MQIRDRKLKQNEPPEIWNKMMNIEYRADSMYRMSDEEGRELILYTRDKKTYLESSPDPDAKKYNGFCQRKNCNHMKLYEVYIDSDACIMCDKEMIEKIED